MRWVISILVAVLLIQIGYVPCSAQGVAALKGHDIDRSKLKVGAYIWVAYYSTKHRIETAKGYLKSVDDAALTLGSGLWKETIAYRDIIRLTMGPTVQDILRLEAHSQIVPGARVRVRAPSVAADQIVGTLVAVNADTFVLKAEGRSAPMAIPLALVTRLEVRQRPAHHGRSAAIGATIGFLAGGLIGASIVGGIAGGAALGGVQVEEKYIIAASLGGGAFFAGIGGVVGGLMGGETWVRVPLPTRIGLAPKRNGRIRLAGSVNF